MASEQQSRVSIDEIVAAATDGVLRALEARQINAPEFTNRSGFFVKFDVTCGSWPRPVETGPFGGELPSPEQ
jgi:hypothetical protein